MKRYKVVQDARGYWGIVDTFGMDFASWGSTEDTGAWALDEIVYYAGNLNTFDDVREREEFSWDGEYLPRAEA